jgi:peptidyl-prolyl cis-trans isomerase C
MFQARKNARNPARVIIGSLGVAAALLAYGVAPVQAKVLAKVNGVEITEEDLKIAMDDLGAGIPRQLEGKARESYVLDFLVDEQLVVQKAQADKLAETPEFSKKLAYLRDKALMEILLGNVAKSAATEAAIKQTYEEAAKNQKPDTEYHAHHILVATEDDAKKALTRVKGGEDFGKVADEVSKDPGSKGGDLGWFTRDRMVPEFGDAVAKMKPGQISDPIKSQFDQVRDQVSRYVVQKAQSELVLKLRENAKIERADQPADAAKPAAKPEEKK